MKDFYTTYYAAVEHSQAHHLFCERVFGRDLAQHGFADQAQLDLLCEVTRLGPQHRALDLGCGSGLITEYLSDATGAHLTGLDYIPEAIRQAQARTAAKADRLAFVVGDINRLELAAGAFDIAVLIDIIYFSTDYAATLRELGASLRPGGQMAILFSHGREPWVPPDAFQPATLPPDRTPLADALHANDLPFRTWDLTRQDYALALKRIEVLTELRPQFDAEGFLKIYENRMRESNSVRQRIEEGLHVRYLYHVGPCPTFKPVASRPESDYNQPT